MRQCATMYTALSSVALLVSGASAAAYEVRSEHMLDPIKNVAFINDTGKFWEAQKDNDGFFSVIGREGAVLEADLKGVVMHSRLAYGLSRAFMATGDEKHLQLASQALNFIYEHGHDEVYGGWHTQTDSRGNRIPTGSEDNEKWLLVQTYALLGMVAMCEATNDPAVHCETLDKSIQEYDQLLWDTETKEGGYFEKNSRDFSRQFGKGIGGVLDVLNVWAMPRLLINHGAGEGAGGKEGNAAHQLTMQRYSNLSDLLMTKVVASMDSPSVKYGVASGFYTNWTIAESDTTTQVGHLYKIIWTLARMYALSPSSTEYLDAIDKLWRENKMLGAFDEQVGSPHALLDWRKGITSRQKGYWQAEQSFMAGMTVLTLDRQMGEAERDEYLEVIDKSLMFFYDRLVDPVHGDVFSQLDETGKTVVKGDKGSIYKSCFHSMELAFYAYVYSMLFRNDVSKRRVPLFYRLHNRDETKEELLVVLTPIPIEKGRLVIESVDRDGEAYTDFDSNSRTVRVRRGEGGVFRVVFGIHDK
ncbi:unnamed protein product [Vitrella brassicaformis CCMP3155]|uniref:N-acylglucosamine 2-epimerase n=2 Tax=Vitrella brassicaformis TaxID=1169539 RepID=A0A0G4EMR8_VITBC|nr:unnamed protein product [Vitrella brassicaformis CCMP3155]|eukprot:CEL98466.1 unnamed protein product [Vitrella brassicaformis CCMP3155]